MEAVSKIYLKLRYYFKLWRLNLDLKSVSVDACLRSKGKSFHKMRMPAFFSATDIWLTQSVGSSIGTIIDSSTRRWSSALTASFLASGRVRAQRTTGVAPSSTVRWTLLPGRMPGVSRKLLNVAMRSCRNAINNFKVPIVHCDKSHSLCGITTE